MSSAAVPEQIWYPFFELYIISRGKFADGEALVNAIVDIALLMSGSVGKTKRGRPSHMGCPAPKDNFLPCFQ